MDKKRDKVAFVNILKTGSTFDSDDEKIYNSEEKSAENEHLQTGDEMEQLPQLKFDI